MGRNGFMRTREEALSYGLSFPDAYQDAPFHDENWQLARYKGSDVFLLYRKEDCSDKRICKENAENSG